MRFRRYHETLSDGIEDDLELRVVFLLEPIELAGEVGVGCEHLPRADDGSHDLDVDLNGALAVKHT